MRLGTRPRLIVTTAPRATALVRRVRALGGTVETLGRTAGNVHIESVLRNIEARPPVRLVHAYGSKSARAEPVAAWFETGRAKLAGRFPELEDELAGLTCGGGYEGPGNSPDRADAMVWAMSELVRRRAEPRIRSFQPQSGRFR